MSRPGDDDRTLILRYFAGELDPSTRQWVEQRVRQDPEFNRMFELYKLPDNESKKDHSTIKHSPMTNIKFTPPDHKRPKPRYGVLIFLIVLLIVVLLAMFLIDIK